MPLSLTRKDSTAAVLFGTVPAAASLFAFWTTDDAPGVLNEHLVMTALKLFLWVLTLPGMALSAVGTGEIHVWLAAMLNALIYGGGVLAFLCWRRRDARA